MTRTNLNDLKFFFYKEIMILISAVYIKIKNKIIFEALPRYSHLLLEICVFFFFFKYQFKESCYYQALLLDGKYELEACIVISTSLMTLSICVN